MNMEDGPAERIVREELRRLRRWQLAGWVLVLGTIAAGAWLIWRFVILADDPPRKLGSGIAEVTAAIAFAIGAWVQAKHKGALANRLAEALGFAYQSDGRGFARRLPFSPKQQDTNLTSEDFFSGRFQGHLFECAEVVLTERRGTHLEERLRFLLIEWATGGAAPRVFLAHDDALQNGLQQSWLDGKEPFTVTTRGKSVVQVFRRFDGLDRQQIEPFAQAVADVEGDAPEPWRFLFADCHPDRIFLAVRIRHNFLHMGGLWTGRSEKVAGVQRARQDMLAAAGIVLGLEKARRLAPAAAGEAQVSQTRA